MSTTTSNSSNVQTVPMSIVYYVDPGLADAVKAVLRKAAKWKRHCCAKKTGKRFCEQYGCSSLDELLLPLKQFKFKRKAKGKPREASRQKQPLSKEKP